MSVGTCVRACVLVTTVVWLLAGTAEAQTVACLAKKLAGIGKLEAKLLLCHAKVASTNDSSRLAACQAAASSQFATSFAQAGVCGGDPLVGQALADECASTIADAMTDTFPSRCEAAKRKAAGKSANKQLRCHGKAWRNCADVESACLAGARAAFSAGLTRAGSCPQGTSPESDVESRCVQPALDALGSDIAVACVLPTTSTSTTIPPCSSATRSQPCDVSCSNSWCAPESPGDPQHLGSGDICVGMDNWYPDINGYYGQCRSDAECEYGRVCVAGIQVPLGGTANICLDPCTPYTCSSSHAPACGGSCPDGQICGQRYGTDTCDCASPAHTCFISEAPTCGGTCLNGETCGQVSGRDVCQCVAPDHTCAISQAPTCGGTCPTGHCGTGTSGASCTCICDEPLSCPFVAQWGTSGNDDGQLYLPLDVAVDDQGNVYVADRNNARIQKLASDGTFRAKWGSRGSADGQFDGPAGIAVDANRNVFVVDGPNNARIQKFTSNGAFLTKWSVRGSDVAVDSNGNVFVVESQDHRVRKFTNTGVFLTIWGSMGAGPGQFQYPNGVGVDPSGNVFVADSGNARIQKFDNTGMFLASWGGSGSGDGQFDVPQRLTVDRTGHVFVTDTASGGNSRIQEFDNSGTFIRSWGCPGGGEGQLDTPIGIDVDASRRVFVADANNDRIVKFACP